MGQRSISVRSLGDLVAHGYGMNALCERCRHRVDLDMTALIQRFGARFVYVGKTVVPYLRCTRCGAKGAENISVQIHNAHNPWAAKHGPHQRP
jgi:DNA-directed RNA polymerase subunit RPC12/RpoP